MKDTLRFSPESGCLAVVGELTIYQAKAAAEGLRSAFASGQLRHVDLAAVTELDAAGLQWLLVAARLTVNDGEPVTLTNHSEPVCDALALAGIEVSS
ncbi:STAS domain-containing protein [Natronospirillum operosum]|uniref:STAS domain-containing protein n=1 Tax=Natronospirillum operosum TaxID=2759953 RepID=A0A4Z0WAW4_9GAMM|nr:STAS domain-containing protein [Natronospirillum operosum]TGG95789.1 STAS domain-containing protein [Natronospirillum operosum]